MESAEFTLHRLIIHKIKKEQHSTEVEKILSTELLKGDNDVAVEFSQKLREAYHKKHSVEYSKFDDSSTDEELSFQALLDDYLYTPEDKKDEAFIKFSKQATELLSIRMQEKTLSVGGYIVFGEYELRDRFIFIALVKRTPAFDTEEEENSINLKLKPVLSIEELGMAAFINVSIYQNKNDDRRYISFLRGKRDIANYFVNFLNAGNFRLKTSEITKLLVESILDYLSRLNLDERDIERKRVQIFEFIDGKRKKREAIHLESVANLLNPENPEDFIDYCHRERQIDSVIEKVEASILNRLRYFRFVRRGFLLKFDINRYRDKITIVEGDDGYEYIKIEGFEDLISELKRELAKGNGTN